jgi:predicted NBD/HSP70 family sugar kinase/biotin operon repressor
VDETVREGVGPRERNSARVVDALRRRGTASRSDLARLTGLSRTTVGHVVAELQGRGVVVEHEAPDVHGRGRPPVLLRFDPSAGVAVGVDFDHDHVRVALADLSATVLAEGGEAIDVDHAAGDAVDAVVAIVEALRREAGVEHERLVGAGVGLAGPFDTRTGVVASPLILPGWAGRRVRCVLEERLGLPVEVDNDANLGALAEGALGAARGLSDFVYVRLGSGLGAGLVVGGRLCRGANGLAGEIGHVQVRADGAVCRCGNRGCLETVASESALRALLEPALGRPLGARDVVDLVAAGELAATRVVDDAGRAVGRVLADLCNALNPEAIVVGGELSEAGEPLLRAIRETVERHALPAAADGVRVVSGELGERAELLGALRLAITNADGLAFASRKEEQLVTG